MSIFKVLSTSTSLGFAPARIIAPTVDVQELPTVITSEFLSTLIHLSDKYNADVPLDTPTAYFVPIKEANLFQIFLIPHPNKFIFLKLKLIFF